MKWKFEIEERKDGSIYVYARPRRSFLGLSWLGSWHILDSFMGDVEMRSYWVRKHDFGCIDNAKNAIKRYLDSTEVYKTYSVEIVVDKDPDEEDI